LCYAKKKAPIEKEMEEPSAERPKHQLIVDVYGRTSEPICTIPAINVSSIALAQNISGGTRESKAASISLRCSDRDTYNMIHLEETRQHPSLDISYPQRGRYDEG
jgi:hypothetical protein